MREVTKAECDWMWERGEEFKADSEISNLGVWERNIF